jgi:organic hydroperoxide reductase OsmC/OhrA
MTSFERQATIRWLADPPEGVPRLSVGSGSLAIPLSVQGEDAHPLAASPAELLAGAIGSIFAWFTASELVDAGTQAHELVADVNLTVSDDGAGATSPALSAIASTLSGRVPGIDQERLQAVARVGMSRCLETLVLRTERLTVTVEATLEGG